MDNYDEQRPPNLSEIAEMRQTFEKLLDKDMEATADFRSRQKLKALGVGGLHFFDRLAGGGTSTNLETFNDLANLAAGVRGPSNLMPVGKREQQRTAQQDWDIAAAIVAIRRYPLEAKVAARIKKRLGKTVAQIRKLEDNMAQAKGPYEVIRRNIEDIELRLARGETWPLDDFIT